MKRDIRLYNVLFPIWMFYLLPTVMWLIILPGNFLIDSLVLLAAMAVFHYDNKKVVWKRSILRIWGIGFLSDLLGAALTFPLMLIFESFDTFRFPGGQLIVLPGIALAGVLIYTLNKAISFKNCGLAPEQIRRLSLALAIFTAPYTMLWPVEWLYF